MKFEDVLLEVNGFGRYQALILTLSFLGRFSLPCHFMLNNFIAAIPSHHCDINGLDTDGAFANLTAEQRRTASIPLEQDGEPSSCLMFSEPQFHLLSNSSNTTDLPAAELCQNGWVFDNSTFKSTLASEWDLVCKNKGLNKATATIFFIGVMFGALTFGSLSDRYGRRNMLLVSYILGMVFGLISAFSTSYIMFAVLRFLTGFGITGIPIVSSVLVVEWVDIEHRKLVGVVDSLSWTFGHLTFPLIAYCIRDWRWLTIAVTCPVIPAIISWWWVPESARWLIATGQLEKAQYYLHKCARMNQREATSTKPENLALIVQPDKSGRKYTFLDLVRTPKMRQLSILTGLTWFGVASTTYGIRFNITGFGVDMYLTQFIYAAIDLPAKFLVYYLLEKFGRRKTEVGSLFLTGVCLGINIFVPKAHAAARTIVATLAKGFCGVSFGTVVLYSSELYPTVIRQNGMGYNSSMGRLGVAVAPLILLLDDIWASLPQVVLCSIAILTSLIANFLPETRGKCLPETIEDIERPKV
ncbi:solute carrier family 22 member 7-like isoform X2 [Engraulis encrasicolus]